MFRIAIAVLGLFASASPAIAQDRPATMLVLDASGSMWGQIDGVNKITIARSVLSDLLVSLPEDQALGLSAYGHRTKGDCTDIETLVAPGMGTKDSIRAKVADLNPKGKTPLSAAVIEAARALRHTEEAATVILISDGIETCEADPCAVGAELDASGVDFTAHVVGFDVADPVAQAQLRCLAENTGGTYLPASNAKELSEALTKVTADLPAPMKIGFSAVEVFGDATRPLEAVWEILDASEEIVMDATQTLSGTSAALPAGSYTVRALRLSDETVMTQEVVLKDGLDGHVTLTFEAALPPATLEAPASGAAGATIDVTWTGPDRDADYIATAVPDAEDGAYLTYEYTAKGNPLPLRLPAQPGSFEIRYVEATTLQVLGRTTIEVTGMDNALSAPAEAPIGSTIPVLWEGAGYSEDYIDIALPGSEPLTYITYAYVSDGNPVEIQVPVKPGAYEIRYITGQDASVFATIPLTVTDVPATLTAPDSVAAGGTLPVSFTGPMNANDYLTIAEQSDGPLGYLTYEYVSGRSEVTLTAPETPGTYALRYIADGPDTAVLVEKTLTVQ